MGNSAWVNPLDFNRCFGYVANQRQTQSRLAGRVRAVPGKETPHTRAWRINRRRAQTIYRLTPRSPPSAGVSSYGVRTTVVVLVLGVAMTAIGCAGVT
jgi:hypothetical protein